MDELTIEELKEIREALLDYLDQPLLPNREQLATSACSKVTVAIVRYEDATR